MTKFKVGDVIEATDKVDGEEMGGFVGTVMGVGEESETLDVRWDKRLSFGHKYDKHGWNAIFDEVSLYKVKDWQSKIK